MQAQLLSTDFDGTLVTPFTDGRCLPRLADRLRRLKEAGCRWVINTGRSIGHMLEGLERFGAPVGPDFLVVNERHVYAADGEGWMGMGEWNRVCDERHRQLNIEAAELFERVERWAAPRHDMTIIREDGALAGLVAADAAAMERTVDFLERTRGAHPDFDYQRNSIYLRFNHRAFNKGAALAEVWRLCGCAPERTFAAGDNHNDLPMLDGARARLLACPSNSVPEVKRAVRRAGGFVASEECGAGVAAALDHFFPQLREDRCAGDGDACAKQTGVGRPLTQGGLPC